MTGVNQRTQCFVLGYSTTHIRSTWKINHFTQVCFEAMNSWLMFRFFFLTQHLQALAVIVIVKCFGLSESYSKSFDMIAWIRARTSYPKDFVPNSICRQQVYLEFCEVAEYLRCLCLSPLVCCHISFLQASVFNSCFGLYHSNTQV